MSDPATETPTETAPTEDADVKMEVEATEKTTTTTEPEKATCTTETMSEEPATETPKEAAPKETDADVKMEVEATEKATTTTEPEKAACTTETKEVLVKPAETEAPSWDNTNRKIVVHNVMKFMNPKHVERLSQSLLEGLQQDFPEATFAKVKKPPKDNWVQITLHKDEWVQPLIDQINSGRMTNKKGGVLYATRVDNNKGDKRGRDDGDAENGNKRQRTSDDDDKPRPPRDPRDVVTPFWKTPYEEQLKAKTKQMVQQSCMKIVKEIKGRFRLIQREAKRNPNRDMVKEYNWIKCKRPIELEEIIIPPGLERNKSEFTFGYRCPSELAETEKDQQIPAVGFMASGWAGGVSRPHVCQNIPSEACGIVDMVDAFLATSVIPPYDSKTHRGFWRYLTIRTSRRTGQCMVVIVHAPPKGGAGAKDESDDLSGVFESEKQRLIAILTEKVLKCERPREFGTDELLKFPFKPDSHEEMPISVTSLFFQEYEGLSNPKPEHPVQHVFGKTAMHEKLGKCTFQISPGAFFQVNTAGAENLYAVVVDKVKEVAKDPAETVLLDVCCGTGTIGMTCMKEGACGRVVGVDISIPAIDDAKINAELNGFTEAQTRFVASRAELVLVEELKTLQGGTSSVVAVVDPARDGLHQDVAKALRLSKGIQRIVYVSCNPTGSLVKDAGLLCAPPTKKYGGLPFVITSARPVDMFPLTDHCEMVLTFDRMSESEMKGGDDKPKEAKKEDDKPKEAKKEDDKPKEEEDKPKESVQDEEKPKESVQEEEKPKESVQEEEKPKESVQEEEKPKENVQEEEKPKESVQEEEKPKEVPAETEAPKEEVKSEDIKPESVE